MACLVLRALRSGSATDFDRAAVLCGVIGYDGSTWERDRQVPLSIAGRAAAAGVTVVAVHISDLLMTHVDDAVALWHDSGLTRPWNDPHADLARAMAGPSSTVLAAVDSGVLAGTAMVGHDGHRGWVYYLAVRPDRRRTGLGRDLMSASERWLAERDVPKVQLMVRTTNAAVVDFYESLGYEDGGVLVLGKFLNR